MSERKTRGRQRIPIRLIENRDDLLVSFSKRRVGVYKKASELSTLCGVDVGAIIFSPSGIPHSFFTPDFDSVVYGRRNLDEHHDCYGRLVEGSSRIKIRELNKRLDEVMEQLEREEKREKQLDGVVNAAAEVGWWEVPVDSLSMEEVKEQMEWFQTLRAQIKTRAQELKSGGSSSAAAAALQCVFAPPSLDGYAGGGRSSHVVEQYLFPPPPPPPPFFDVSADDQYLFPPAPPHPPYDLCGGIGRVEQYLMGHCLGDGHGYVSREAQHHFSAAHGSGEAGPSKIH